MITELGLDRPPNLAEFHVEDGVLKNARTPAEPAQIAPLTAGAGIFGQFCREVLEGFAGIQARHYVHRTGFSLGIFLDGTDQDVPRAAVFIGLESELLLLVVALQDLVGDLDIAGEVRAHQFQVFDIDVFL